VQAIAESFKANGLAKHAGKTKQVGVHVRVDEWVHSGQLVHDTHGLYHAMHHARGDLHVLCRVDNVDDCVRSADVMKRKSGDHTSSTGDPPVTLLIPTQLLIIDYRPHSDCPPSCVARCVGR
jgi:hypothetical protein